MPSPPPPWDTAALLSGLPVTNWKKRTGGELSGTLAQCIERFLSLPHHQQRECTLQIDGYNALEAAGIVAFVERHGLPPAIAARVKDAAEWLIRATAEMRYTRPPSADPRPPTHTTPLHSDSDGPKTKKDPAAKAAGPVGGNSGNY